MIILRWLGRGALLVVLLVLILVGAVIGTLWATIPARDDQVAIAGVSAPVEITLDRNGIPFIKAASADDAWTTLGYLHARDRLLQMELMRRGASGRLAEIIGAPGLRLDRYTRLLNLAARAESDVATLDPAARGALEAYARGVNAWIGARGIWSAPEFVALGLNPEPWTPRDSLLWQKSMALFLTGNMRTELARLRLSATLPRTQIDELWPTDETQGIPQAALPALAPDQLARIIEAIPVFGEDAPLPATASNAWVVTGANSASGRPILANDPHLQFSQPILWHLARVEAPGLTLVGAFAPGVPFLVLGRNENLAWGFTTTHSDTQDVFIERLVDADRYLTPDGPAAFEVREETIRVRFGDPVTMRYRATGHGPVISDLDPVAGTPRGHVLAVAMAAVAPGDTSATALYRLNLAGSVAQGIEALSLINAPQQNMMLADRAGSIAMVAPARVPIRRAGDGSFPVPGWDGSHDWVGFADPASLPRIVDPESGRIVNANNRIVPPGSQPFLTRDWYGDFRFRRIVEVLGQGPQTVASSAAIQTDITSQAARDLLPLMTRIGPQPGAAGRALDLLRGWDGRMDIAAPQPLIFTEWTLALGREIAAAKLGPDWETFLDARSEFLMFALTRGTHWCGTGTDPCAALLTRSLDQTMRTLAEGRAADPATWRWGDARRVRFDHPILRFIPYVGDWFGTAVPMAGDGQTPMRAGMRLTGARPYDVVHGAGYRAVYDLADPDGSGMVIATGQSGHPFSAHYRDLNALWLAGGTLRLGPVAEAPSGRITLMPGRP